VWFKHRAWIPVAWLLCLGNVASVWFAARPAEPWHATVHAVLAVLFGLGAQRLGLRKNRIADADAGGRGRELDARRADPAQLQDVEGRLAELEERLDFTERALVDVRNRAQQPPKE
jgi:DNA segregation ATPase FtsK/SpoIIIE-like protein